MEDNNPMAQIKLFNISEVVGRLSKAAIDNRHDQVVRNVHAIFESKMKSNPESIVSSLDVAKIYSTFAGLDPQSNFKEYFEDVFKEEQASGQQNKSVFARDDSFSEEFRPSVVEYQPNVEDQIKAASLIEIQKVITGSVDNAQYRFKGITRVADTGGFANWSVSFETGRGVAEIDVPVILTEDSAYAPQKFTSANGAFAFTKESLSNFAKSYSGSTKKNTVNSGLQYLGTQSMIPAEMFVSDVDQTPALEVTSLSGAMPMDPAATASIDGMEQSTVNAIVLARTAALKKLSLDESGKAVNNTVQLNYAGSVRFEELPNDENNFNGVVAFNASKKTKLGTRTITIPVEVKGTVHLAENFVDQNQTPYILNATNVENFFTAGGDVSVSEDAEAEAFGDAFLASIASYSELCKEMKQSIAKGNMSRANAVIKAISNRFEDAVVKNAMDDYLEYVREAHDKKIPVTSSKTAVAAWHTDIADEFEGVLKSSSIVMN